MGVSIDNGFVFDVSSSTCVAQCVPTFFKIGIRGGHARDHHGTTVPPQRRLQHSGQFGISVRHVLNTVFMFFLAARFVGSTPQNTNDIAQRQQTFVDVDAFFQPCTWVTLKKNNDNTNISALEGEKGGCCGYKIHTHKIHTQDPHTSNHRLPDALVRFARSLPAKSTKRK